MVFLGDALDCYVDVGDLLVRIDTHPSADIKVDEDIFLSMAVTASRVVPSAGAN